MTEGGDTTLHQRSMPQCLAGVRTPRTVLRRWGVSAGSGSRPPPRARGSREGDGIHGPSEGREVQGGTPQEELHANGTNVLVLVPGHVEDHSMPGKRVLARLIGLMREREPPPAAEDQPTKGRRG